MIYKTQILLYTIKTCKLELLFLKPSKTNPSQLPFVKLVKGLIFQGET